MKTMGWSSEAKDEENKNPGYREVTGVRVIGICR